MTGEPSRSVAGLPSRQPLTLLVVFCHFAILCVVLAIAAQDSLGAALLVALLTMIPLELTQGRHGSAMALGVVIFLMLILLPPISSAPSSVRRNGCVAQVRQIQLAVWEYTQDHGHCPPPYSVDQEGRPLHSWRVLILPYMDDPQLLALYKKIDLTKPWSDPKNLAVGNQMPSIYQCPEFIPRRPGEEQTTAYMAVVGSETLWPTSQPLNLASKQVDLSGKLSIVEAERFRQHWMSTGDPSIDVLTSGVNGSLLQPGPHQGSSVCAFADVHTKAISEDLPVENLLRMLTISAPKPAQQGTTQSADLER